MPAGLERGNSMHRRGTFVFLVAVLLSAGATVLRADDGPSFSIPQRAQGAERIVVAEVRTLTATYETNEFGDRLIVSHLVLGVEQTWKGSREGALPIDVLGGTAGGVTLRVSSVPTLAAGERAVFFLERNRRGVLVPHLRGQGILKVDSTNRIKGTALTLDDVRRLATGAGR
jgi:hypothetical protein